MAGMVEVGWDIMACCEIIGRRRRFVRDGRFELLVCCFAMWMTIWRWSECMLAFLDLRILSLLAIG